MSLILEHGSIISDSIIENKDRTKSYWEQRMMAVDQKTVQRSDHDASATTEFSDHSDYNEASARDSISSGDNLQDSYKSENYELKRVKDEKQRYEREVILKKERKKSSLNGLPSIESKIEKELQEMREREEELRRLRREQELLLKICKENAKGNTMCNGNTVVDDMYTSIPTTDEGNYSEYGSEEKENSIDDGSSRVITPDSQAFTYRRTQSLDSVSSGHSSGSDRIERELRRKVTVKPYEEPEEVELVAFKGHEGETAIERDIRLTKEREEALRREKGIVAPLKSEPTKIDVRLKVKNINNAIANDPRGVQHRLATNRIQQEIQETSERENELRTLGKILTTSEETVDSKVTRFTDLAEFSISEGKHKQQKMTRSLSTSHLFYEDESSILNKNNIRKTSDVNIRKFNKHPTQKGVMERFISTKGQVPMTKFSPNTNNFIKQIPKQRVVVAEKRSPIQAIRKGYTPAGTKIQEELREMKKREDELRLQRNSLGRSQPNLLALNDDFENEHQNKEEYTSWSNCERNVDKPNKLKSSLLSRSNPNLENEGLSSPKNGLRSRNPLIATWESRIASFSNNN